MKEKPLLITEAAEAVGKDIYTLHPERLIQDGVVQLCGLTPTDIMHIRGDFREYCTEASRLGAEFAAFNLGVAAEELCDMVYGEVKRKLYLNIVKAMLENKYPEYMKNGVDPQVERFISASFEEIKNGKPDGLFSAMFSTRYDLVGVGAPICVFLADVANMLGTRAIIPENHQVANALGAIIGSVSATCCVEIQPNYDAEGAAGYLVFGDHGSMSFETLEEAVDFAASEASRRAKAEAEKRGAVGEITVTTEVQAREAEITDGSVYLGTAVTARAVGSMGF